MENSIQSFIQTISLAQTEKELRLRFMDQAGDIFHAQHWSIALRDNLGNLGQIDLKGLPDHFVDYYTQYGMSIDPLRTYVLEHHVPVHERVLFTEADWKRSDLYVHGCGRQYDHEHVMTGAIVGSGKLIGLVSFARTSQTPAFTDRDLIHLSAVCSHVSASLAIVRTLCDAKPPCAGQFASEWLKLTPREQQIAELVAQGLTNAAIGAQLWITQNTVKQALKRMFCRLNVSARAELVAKLFRS